jgi:copper ion binding protein
MGSDGDIELVPLTRDVSPAGTSSSLAQGAARSRQAARGGGRDRHRDAAGATAGIETDTFDAAVTVGSGADTRAVFTVSGMTCASCVGSIERAVRGIDGVALVSVALLSEKVDVSFDSSRTDARAIAALITDVGYGAELASTTTLGGAVSESSESSPTAMAHEMRARQARESGEWWRLLAMAAVLSVPLAIVHMLLPMFDGVEEALMKPTPGLRIPIKVCRRGITWRSSM